MKYPADMKWWQNDGIDGEMKVTDDELTYNQHWLNIGSTFAD